MSESKPLVSIVLPVRNAQNYVQECIGSLLSQSYDNLEIIAIDDCSTDNTYAILKRFRKMDKRLHISRNVKHYGLRLTLNRCVKKTHGNFIAFMNQNDIATKSKIGRQLSFLQQNPKVAAVGTQCFYIDEEGRKIEQSAFPIDHQSIYNTLIHGISVQPEAIMINRLNVPKDLIQFAKDTYPYIYRRLLLNIVKYGQVANIPTKLYLHRSPTPQLSRLRTYMPNVLKFWVKATTIDEYRPSLRSFFFPMVKSI